MICAVLQREKTVGVPLGTLRIFSREKQAERHWYCLIGFTFMVWCLYYMRDKFIRSLAKTMSWRIVATIATFVVTYIITGELRTSTIVAIVVTILNTVLYFAHERAWDHFIWGKTKPLDREEKR